MALGSPANARLSLPYHPRSKWTEIGLINIGRTFFLFFLEGTAHHTALALYSISPACAASWLTIGASVGNETSQAGASL